MQEWLIFGVPAVALIVVLVELAKRYGLDSRYAPLASIAFGVLFAVLGRLAEIHPGVAEWYEVVVIGLLAGLTASGLYSGQKALRGR